MTAKPGFRADVEGIRAIAILLVVAYHAKVPGFSGGYIGVDIFFVLSGYLITGLLVREVDRSGTIDLPMFYARRARRLLPALALTLLVTTILSAMIYAPAEQTGVAMTSIWTAAYSSNLYFATTGTNYMHAAAETNPLLHTWSLSVEEQFYFVWPIFVMFGLSVFSLRPHPNRNRRLLWWMGAAATLSFAISLYLTNYLPSYAFYTSPTRAWEFALGAIAVLLPQGQPPVFNEADGVRRKPGSRIASISAIAGVAGILIAGVSFSKGTAFPGFAALLPAISTVLILRSSTRNTRSAIVRMLSIRPLQEIGRLSYSWYLWHWPILVLGAAVIEEPSLATRVSLVVIALALSQVSYALVEDPIRHSRRLARRRVYALAMAGLLAAFGIGTSVVWRQASLWAARRPEQIRFTRARVDAPALRRRCESNYFEIDPDIDGCTTGPDGSTATIVLLGDSHAAQWYPAMESIAAQRGSRLVTMTKNACAMVDAPFFYEPLGRVYDECAQWRENALNEISRIRPILTLMNSSDGYTFQDEAWRDGISSVVGRLAKSSENVLVIRDNPRPDFDVPTCLARQLWRPFFIPPPACEFPDDPAEDLKKFKVFNFQKLAARQFNNVLAADLSDRICQGGTCPLELDSVIVYRDSNHLTASFVKTLEDDLARQVDLAISGNATSRRLE